MKLVLRGRRLTSFDATEGEMSHKSSSISELDLTSNMLTQVLRLNRLRNLITIDLSNNQLTVLCALPTGLKHLRAQSNQITDCTALCACEGLEFVDLSSNCLTELPLLPASVKRLNVSHNFLQFLSDLPQRLTILNASNNKIDEAHLPPHIRVLNIAGNPLQVSADEAREILPKLSEFNGFAVSQVSSDVAVDRSAKFDPSCDRPRERTEHRTAIAPEERALRARMQTLASAIARQDTIKNGYLQQIALHERNLRRLSEAEVELRLDIEVNTSRLADVLLTVAFLNDTNARAAAEFADEHSVAQRSRVASLLSQT